jgi:hypothetical protein
MDNFAEFLTTGEWNTPTHILERRLILSVVKVLCTGCTHHSLHPHCTHKVENAKGKGCTCTRCTRGSGIPGHSLSYTRKGGSIYSQSDVQFAKSLGNEFRLPIYYLIFVAANPDPVPLNCVGFN